MSSKGINPFEDDLDDDTFLSSGRSNNHDRDWESENASNIRSQIDRHEHSMLESTQRSLGVLYQTEEIGNETAEELLRQGDQLRRTEKKVDKINADLDTSQRYVTSLKGIFSGMRNYFRPAVKKDPGWETQDDKSPSKLQRTVDNANTASMATSSSFDHPGLRLRDPEAAQMYGQRQSSSTINKAVDENIDELGLGIARLKDLAIGLGEEMDEQNDVIERLDYKVEKVNVRIDKTTKDMKKILRS
ncbi:synaptosomal-associated protein 29-like [Anneissia japonica]|uniref:synaptosomal-associated protein 29-like n=1 Tax=Anneissia japonica TaxID=1529436 RepID=UPI0014255409|nr:synaptosomal-associated protein 29-like [Anneissia japonica]